MFLLQSSLSYFFLPLVACVMILLALVYPADGIRWLVKPHEQTNVQQGLSFNLQWHYEMEENEAFVASEIGEKDQQDAMASRYKGDKIYYKHRMNDDNQFFSISGKNNVTLTLHSAEIGQNITYCCEVEWISETGTKRTDRRCSKVFVYDVPRITYLTPQLSSKQGDSIKLQCNATGTPTPHVEWIHDDTKELIDSSSDTVLNITGKRSEGRYCCDATNGFVKERACTAVNVTEYEPVNTTLSVKQINKDGINFFHIKCNADASPPANHFIINIDDKEYNSSDGRKTYKVPCARRDIKKDIAVSCIPGNKYGQGQAEKVVLPLNVLFSDNCTRCNCNTEGLDERTEMSSEKLILIIGCVVVGVVIGVIIALLITIWWRRKTKVRKVAEVTVRIFKDAYQEPLDAVVPGRDGSQSLLARSSTTSTDDGYTTIKECVLRPRKQNFSIPTKHERHMEDNPYQEPLDVVVLERDGSKSLIARSSTISSDDGYASVEDCLFKPKKQNVCMPMDTKLEEDMEDITYQEPLDAVVPEQDEAQAVATNNATVEECGLKLSRDVNDTLDPIEED